MLACEAGSITANDLLCYLFVQYSLSTVLCILRFRCVRSLPTPSLSCGDDMGRQPSPDVVSLVYKHLSDGTPMHFSVYPPTPSKDRHSAVPALIYFHGGGLVVGNRYSWHPEWLQSKSPFCLS